MISRSLGYIVSSFLALLFYVVWIFFEVSLSSRGAHGVVLIWFALFGGCVFLALVVPWTVAVSVFPKGKCSGKLYFTFAGTILVFVLGCALSSLVPKPLFIEDQTFVEGFIIAVKRQGVCFSLAGSVFGASYWFVSERHVRANKAVGSSAG